MSFSRGVFPGVALRSRRADRSKQVIVLDASDDAAVVDCRSNSTVRTSLEAVSERVSDAVRLARLGVCGRSPEAAILRSTDSECWPGQEAMARRGEGWLPIGKRVKLRILISFQKPRKASLV